MILSDIKQYLIQHKRVTLGDLANHFDTEPEAMKGMLDHWVRKGNIVELAATSACNGKCAKCCCEPVAEIYEWQA